MLKKTLYILAAGLLLSGSLHAQTNDYEKALSKLTGDKKWDIEKPGAMDGVPAPDFTATTLDGKSIKLSDLKGKVVVLNFWFIACVPCRMEVKPFNEVVEQFKDKDVVFVSVARDKAEDLKKHLVSNPFNFETVADPQAGIAKDVFHVFGYPTTIILDRNGIIRYYSLGGKIDENAVRAEFAKKLVPVITANIKKKG